MERNREVRRASIVGSNGFNRRRHRTNMLKDSPDEDGGAELQESVRLRDRTRKDRERERQKDLRERSSRSKRRRGERLTSNRDDIGGDETSEESFNDDDDYEDDEDTRLIPMAAAVSNHSLHSSLAQQCSNNNYTNSVVSSNHLQHGKSFPPASSSSSSSKVFRAAPTLKPDEIISVSIPRKARSASTKRSHDWTSTSSNNYSGGGGEQVHRQDSSSPARQGGASTSAPMSPPSSSNAFAFRKKLKSGGGNGRLKLKPPKEAVKQSSSNPEELEIEIAEVLFGLKTQSQPPSSKKEDSREVDRSNGDDKPHVSSPVSNCDSVKKQILGPNSNPLQPVASKRKRPPQTPENSSYGGSAKLDTDKIVKSEISSTNLEKKSASKGEKLSEIGGISEAAAPPPKPVKMNLELKAAAGGLRESIDSDVKKDMSFPEDKKFSAIRNRDLICTGTTATTSASSIMINANAVVSDVENQKQQKLEIDLMAPPAQEIRIHFKATATAADQKSSLSIGNTELESDALKDKVDEKRKIVEEQSENAVEEEAGLKKEIETKGRSVVDMQLDLEKPVRNENAAVNSSANKLQLYNDKQQANREEPLSEKSSQSKTSIPLPVPMAGWAGGLPPMGFMAPLQGVVSMDGSTVAPSPIQPRFSQPRPKKCATHSYIARSIHCLQQAMKMNPFWHTAAGSTSLFGSKPANLNRGISNAPDKGNDHSATGQMKQQPILVQQPLPPVPATTKLLGPAFIFPLNQQQAVSGRPNSMKSAFSVGGSTDTSASAMSFSYPAMAANETQYLAIMQNNAYPFPLPANYRGNLALLNGSFYSVHPSQFQHQQTASVQSQKHLVSQQQGPPSSGANGGAGTNQSEKQSLARQGFAMSFGTMNTSMAQNHVIMAAQKKPFKESEDAERRSWTAKAEGGVGQSVGFSRSDSASAAVTSAQANGVSVMPNNHIQGQLAATAAVNRSSNGTLLSEHLNSSSAKIPGGFPQNFVQSSSSHSQWRSSTKTSASLFQHQCRSSAQMQTQISNQKPSTCQGQAPPSISNNQPKNSPSIHATLSSAPMSMQQASTSDPAKAIAVGAANVKGGGTLLPASFSYPHPLPAAEQKQPGG